MSSFLILCSNNKPCLHLVVTCDEKWILYDNWWWCKFSAGLNLQNTSQSQTAAKSWFLFGSVWSTTTFWIPVKPLHLVGMLSKLMRCTENCNACGQHWSTGPNSYPRQRLTTRCTTNTSKVERIGPYLIRKVHPTSRQPTTTSSSISPTFCRQNASITKRMQKMLSKSLSNPQAWIFMLQE